VSEKPFEVKATGIDYQCDFCLTGAMLYTPEAFMTPAEEQSGKFLHVCTWCHKQQMMDRQYPRLTLERDKPQTQE